MTLMAVILNFPKFLNQINKYKNFLIKLNHYLINLEVK